jgi:hypothetical protein
LANIIEIVVFDESALDPLAFAGEDFQGSGQSPV